MTIESTIVHESGHACIARRLDARVSTVTVFASREGHTRFSVLRDKPDDHLAILFAGRAAARWFGFDSPLGGGDYSRAVEVARRAAWPNIGTLDEVAEELLAQAERRADRLVQDNTREIRAFALTLRAAGGRLAGAELDAAFDAAFGLAVPGRAAAETLPAAARGAPPRRPVPLGLPIRSRPQAGPIRARPGLVRPLVLLRGRLADLP